MKALAGIDEAGYGPVVGPLTLGASAFCFEDDAEDADLWRMLAGSVKPAPLGRDPRLIVADSKQAYTPAKGLVGLERTVLGFLRQLGCHPDCLAELLEHLQGEGAADLSPYAWYAGQGLGLPAEADAVEIATAANALSGDLTRTGVRLSLLRCLPVPVGRYNALLARTRNKSMVLWTYTARLADELLRRFGEEGVIIFVDKHGGRDRYRDLLQLTFVDCRLKVLCESEALSAYELARGALCAELRFARDADREYFPTALASMAAKYVRELLMRLLNRWWCGRIEGLRPTAGYGRDGRRFVREVESELAGLGIARELLVRLR